MKRYDIKKAHIQGIPDDERTWAAFVVRALGKAIKKGSIDFTKCIYTSGLSKENEQQLNDMAYKGLLYVEKYLNEKRGAKDV